MCRTDFFFFFWYGGCIVSVLWDTLATQPGRTALGGLQERGRGGRVFVSPSTLPHTFSLPFPHLTRD